jgi:hypothetical protein
MVEGTSSENASQSLRGPSQLESPIPVPAPWSHLNAGVPQVISLAQFTIDYTRGWTAASPNARMRLKTRQDR